MTKCRRVSQTETLRYQVAAENQQHRRQSRQELESRDVSWADSREIAAVGGDEGSKFQPLRNGHDGGVHKSQKVENVEELHAAFNIPLSKILKGDLTRGQRLTKSQFGGSPKPLPHQIGCLGNHRLSMMLNNPSNGIISIMNMRFPHLGQGEGHI